MKVGEESRITPLGEAGIRIEAEEKDERDARERERERETKREEVVERTASVGVGNPALELLSKQFCRVSPPSLHTLLSSPCFSSTKRFSAYF